ncbi:DUF4335 domain-containing protein [Leptolyngbya sp. AN02str]|uniref:DUF4335 domain-containing protein n=1 Tax=Leptolyngbya sp. AN02str TaxID=3423363 RepID=UPI003D323256
MSTSVLRRYTPPTCTLEIAAARSALSSWTDRTVMKNLRFSLSLDDPKLPDHQQIVVSGDRTQLEALSDTVRIYVQQLLEPDAARSHPALRQLSPTSTLLATEHQPTTLQAPQPQMAMAGRTAVAPAASFTGIRLEPVGLLSHILHFGSLATGDVPASVRLSATQLFDLANALDEYAAEAMALPGAERSGSLSRVGWMRAAAVLVLALGVTGGVTKFVMDISQSPTATVATSEQTAPQSARLESTPANGAIANTTPPQTAQATPTPNGFPPLPPPGTRIPVPQPVQPPAGNLRPIPSQQPGGFAQAPRQPVPQPQAVPTPQNQVALAPANRPAPLQAASPSQARQLEPFTQGDLNPDAASTRLGTPENAASAEAGGSAPADASIAAAEPTTTFRPRTNTNPQLAEAESYFQQRWQPPEALNQTLEYRVLVNADGTVQQIVPLGQVAGTYIDRTGMPLIGEAFVSPTPTGQESLIRVVLAPNGSVQTFLEPLN